MSAVIFWLDMQLPVSAKRVFQGRSDVACVHVRELDMRRTPDTAIFVSARTSAHAIITKDVDYSLLVRRLGPPPTIIWLRCGNASASERTAVLAAHLERMVGIVRQGEPLIELGDSRGRADDTGSSG